MKLNSYIFLVIFLFVSLKNFSQSRGAVSGNGNYLAGTTIKDGNQVINIYQTQTKELYQILEFKPQNNTLPSLLCFNYNGKYLYARHDKNYTLWDVKTGLQFTQVNQADTLLFAAQEDYFVILKSNQITSYDTYSGQKIMDYILPPKTIIDKIIISPDDNYIVAFSAPDKIFVYEINKADFYQKLIGVDLKFRKTGDLATCMRIADDGIKIATYKMPTFESVKNVNSTKMLEGKPVGGIGQLKLNYNNCSLSNDGQYVIFYTEKGKDRTLWIYNTFSSDFITKIDNSQNTENQLYPNTWVDNNTFATHGANMMAGLYNVLSGKPDILAFRMDYKPGETDFYDENQIKNRKLSPDLKYVAMQTYKNKVPVLHLRATTIQKAKISLDAIDFLSFSANNRFIYVKKQNEFFALQTKDIDIAMNKAYTIKLDPLGTVRKVVVPETEIKEDGVPPQNYSYYRASQLKEMAKIDTATLKYAFRTIQLDETNVEIQVNLLDANGNIYRGAIDPKWKLIWCNLLLQRPDKSVVKVDFNVTETQDFQYPTAISLVLDHSGSMGEQRAFVLQNSAYSILNTKRDIDAFQLIKYDTNVREEISLSSDKNKLTSSLKKNGLQGYGGTTSLVDAAYLAIKKLKKADRYKHKVLILFTDGFENSSFFTLNEMLTEAIKNKVEINVIGFGKAVNQEYLKTIAYNTGGGFYQLYKTEDLKWVISDIDKKMRNYYSVRFKTPEKGKYIAYLQLCQDSKRQDSLVIAFDNTNTKTADKEDFTSLITPLEPRDINFQTFSKFLIPREKTIIQPVVSEVVLKEFNSIRFPNIQFATDKADIVNPDEKGIIEVVTFLKKYPTLVLEIHGHTDNQGGYDHNIELSRARSEEAKKLITERGIATERIRTKGFGQTKPIDTNDTEQGRYNNRRIEFYIFEK